MSSQAELNAALATPINEAVESNIAAAILSSSPFVELPGSFNTRSLEGNIRPAYAYRSATLERLSEPGFEALENLGVKTIFDLRSIHETEKSPLPQIPNVEVVWQPSTLDDQAEAPTPVINHASIDEMYLSMLESHQKSFKVVLRHVLKHPEKPFLFHCTAGKDRTGVLAALLHALAGTIPHDAQRDYMFTRVGVEPFKDFLMKKLARDGRTLDLNDEKVKQVAGFPEDAIHNLLADLDKTYGGAAQYAETNLGFTASEVEKIQNNLRSI